MKKKIIFAMVAYIMHQDSLNADNFNRRWGANSFITNIPLFFKPASYEQNSNQGCENCENKVISTQVQKVQPKKAIKKVQAEKLAEHMDTQAQIKKVSTHKNDKKQNRKLVNIKHREMREKQAVLEIERVKIEQELIELENKTSEFTLANT